MAKRKSSLSTVAAFMSEQAQDRIRTGGISTLSIDVIRPDPDQPRRLMPIDLIDSLESGELHPEEALLLWLGQADGAEVESALTHNVRELRRLADSIAQHGLIQPITVRPIEDDNSYPKGVEYLIITGERRYWAHVLLVVDKQMIQEGVHSKNPRQVKVNVPASGVSIRAHQLIENLHREDIDAIEKAEGFVALRQELSGVNHGSPQMVSWQIVEEALGISKRYRQYVTGILNLSPEAQRIIAEYGLTERTVRPVRRLLDFPDLQIVVLNKVVAWQNNKGEHEGPGRPIVSAVKSLVEELLQGQVNHGSPPKAKRGTRFQGKMPAFHRQTKGLLKTILNLTDENWDTLAISLATDKKNQLVLDDLQELQRQIEGLLTRVHQE